MNIDETDEKILKHLLVDARQSARQLALKLGMSTVTVLSRIKKLEKEKEDDDTVENEISVNRQELNRIRALRDYEDELEEFEFESRFSNVLRRIDGKTVLGYDKDLDNPGFEKVERHGSDKSSDDKRPK